MEERRQSARFDPPMRQSHQLSSIVKPLHLIFLIHNIFYQKLHQISITASRKFQPKDLNTRAKPKGSASRPVEA